MAPRDHLLSLLGAIAAAAALWMLWGWQMALLGLVSGLLLRLGFLFLLRRG
jgi:hypothetical protein